jgi:LPS sulfotransferase NodH
MHARHSLERRGWALVHPWTNLLARHRDLEVEPVTPENLVWIFGTARTGSTWLAGMMSELPRHVWWNEPLVGTIFSQVSDSNEHMRQRPHVIYGAPYKDTWLASVRSTVMNGAAARFSRIDQDDYLVIQEPNGSRGAPTLAEAFPESRMVLLVRDPRDVVASILDSTKPAAWRESQQSSDNPNAITKRGAQIYARNVEAAKRAFDAHRGRKALIRYEELRTDTFAALRGIYSALEIDVTNEALARSVKKHAWENIPVSRKGQGKPRRKASPGGWREDLHHRAGPHGREDYRATSARILRLAVIGGSDSLKSFFRDRLKSSLPGADNPVAKTFRWRGEVL